MRPVSFQFPTLGVLQTVWSQCSIIQLGKPLARGASLLLTAYVINDFLLPLDAAQEMPEKEALHKVSLEDFFQSVLSLLLCAESQQFPKSLVNHHLLTIVKNLPKEALPDFNRNTFKAHFDSDNFSILFDYLKDAYPIPYQGTFMRRCTDFLSDFEDWQRLSQKSENADEWIQKVVAQTKPTKKLHLAILGTIQQYYQNPARFNAFKKTKTPKEEQDRIQRWILRNQTARMSLFQTYNQVILEGFKKVFNAP